MEFLFLSAGELTSTSTSTSTSNSCLLVVIVLRVAEMSYPSYMDCIQIEISASNLKPKFMQFFL